MDLTEPAGGVVRAPIVVPRSARSADPALAMELQERERVRVGFDLHDGPAQTMSAALLQVRMLEAAEGEALRTGLAELRDTLSTALGEIYGLIDQFGGRSADEAGLEARVRSCVESLTASTGIEATLRFEGDATPASHSLEIAVFRIVQEALSNVRRHSHATHVDVRIAFDPSHVVCEIVDDGTGFAPDAGPTPNRGRQHFGLHGMHQRARLLDGDCEVVSAPDAGTRVTVRIPKWVG